MSMTKLVRIGWGGQLYFFGARYPLTKCTSVTCRESMRCFSSEGIFRLLSTLSFKMII